MVSYTYDDRIHATSSVESSLPGAFIGVDALVSLGVRVYAKAAADIYQSNRFLVLKGIEQTRQDVVRGIKDSAKPSDQHAQQRADALVYFIGPEYRRCLDYLNVSVTGDGLPIGVEYWVKCIGVWCRGYKRCSPRYSDEEAILWGYRNGILSEDETWDEAPGRYSGIERRFK